MRNIAEGNPGQVFDADDLHVERVRRSIAIFDRWRWLFVAFYGTCMIVLVGLALSIPSLFNWFVQIAGNNQAVFWGFGVGASIGASFGMIAHSVVSNLFKCLFGLRNERLMIRYYDAARGNPQERDDLDEFGRWEPR